MKVYIDPASDIHYASFYIAGLFEVYRKSNVKFSSRYFPNFNHNNHFFAFVIKDEDAVKKFVIDFTDSHEIDTMALDWCDVYGKINLAFDTHLNKKIVAIGPSFGIHLFNGVRTLWYAVVNFIKAKSRINNTRRFFADYKSQYYRPKLSDYKGGKTKENHVFYMSSLWKNEPQTNQYRANFMESCKANPSIVFEGGFAPRRIKNFEAFNHLTTSSRISMRSYLDKTKQSLFVFNTPAVKACHGWKLAEYLCLGKAIISTPLSRAMPGNFKEHDIMLITNGSIYDITEKSNQIFMNSELKLRLEQAAKKYFNVHLAPKQVILNLLNN